MNISPSRIALRLKTSYMQLALKVFGKVAFSDRFGLCYYLWPDTRMDQACELGVRTDDIGVIYQTNRILDALLRKPGQIVCVDVGAYIGVISIAMASKLAGRGNIYSFEPGKHMYQRLLENIRLNGFDNIFPFNKAISDIAQDDVPFQLMLESGGSHIINDNPTMSSAQVAGKAASELISAETLDCFAEKTGLRKIELMKIDAEGYDDRAIDGGRNLFENGLVHYLICEYNQGDPCSEGCVVRLKNYGYRIYYIVRNQDIVAADMGDYPFESHRRPLNLLAVSPIISDAIYE